MKSWLKTIFGDKANYIWYPVFTLVVLYGIYLIVYDPDQLVQGWILVGTFGFLEVLSFILEINSHKPNK